MEFEDIIIQMQDEIDTLTRQRDKATEDRQMDGLREEIQQLSSSLEYGNLSQQEYDRLLACREELRQCSAELEALEKHQGLEQSDFDAQITQAQQEVKDLKILISNVILCAQTQAELTFEALEMKGMENGRCQSIKCCMCFPVDTPSE